MNLLLREFIAPPRPHARWVRGSRPKRALYISSPIGLGHAQRDAAIAEELRKLHPDLEIDWLAQHPVTAVLEARGERIHPGSVHLANESKHVESESAEHDLHCFQAIRRMDEILLNNFMVFHDIVRDDQYDLWIGDEAWELDYYLHENPEEKRAAYVWLTDFVGWLPMQDGGEHEAFLTTDYNAEMIEHIARYPAAARPGALRRRPRRHRPGQLRRRPPADQGLDARALRLRRLRDRLRPERLRRPREAAPRTRLRAGRAGLHRHRRGLGRRRGPAPARDRRLPEAARAGRRAADDRGRRAADRSRDAARPGRARDPRLRPRSLPPPGGVRRRRRPGRADDGDGADRERRPFLYFPLRHHFEQNFHVRHRLERHGAGRRMDFDADGPDEIAAAIAEEIGRETDYRPVRRTARRARPR